MLSLPLRPFCFSSLFLSSYSFFPLLSPLQDLLDTVGIHPTIAEEFTLLATKKEVGVSLAKTSC